jgi:hypothetical protein
VLQGEAKLALHANSVMYDAVCPIHIHRLYWLVLIVRGLYQMRDAHPAIAAKPVHLRA